MMKKDMGFAEFGRSMIEMLGVLAIIGILSVGAISSYSNAIRKYKINRLKGEYITFIQDVLSYESEWKKLAKQSNTENLYFLHSYVSDMNLLPKLWIRRNGWIVDSMGAQFTLSVRMTTGKINIDYQTKGKKKDSADARDLCIMMAYEMFKPISPVLYQMTAYSAHYNDDGEQDKADTWLSWYGDHYCTEKNRRCLSEMNLSDIISHCTSCAHNDICRWIIQFE